MIGETIKDFKITSLLGRGGMGEVYVGTQQIVHTRVAIKLLREDISGDRQHVQRFFNEAITASKIQHAGIVKIFDVGFHGSRAFLIMEFLDGESLASRIKRPPRIALGEIVDVAAQLAGILDATQAAGITHRDLKPDNIFIVADAELASRRRIKVLDFGIAKLASPVGTASPEATAMTLTNSSMGTPGYMAPEQWVDAASADVRADIYSLGCVLFELCCGRPPFVASSLPEACAKHMNEVPPRVHSFVAELPAAIDDVIARMLAKKPEARPTIGEIVETFGALRAAHASNARVGEGALDPTVAPSTAASDAITADGGARTARGPSQEPPRSREPLPPARRARRRLGLVIAGAAVLLGAGVLTIFAHRSGDRDRRSTPATTTPTLTATVTAAAATAMPQAPGCPPGMVRVPAAELAMGTDSGMDWEKPVHIVRISTAFCLDRTEVTVGAYAECVAKGVCRPAPTMINANNMDSKLWPAYSQFCNGGREDRRDHPINCVTWEDARTFCGSLDKRLPTEAQWELAARGTDGRRYPWGNEAPNAKRLNLCGAECRTYAKRMLGLDWYVAYEDDDGWGGTAPVGSFPGGASPFGALDMAGNVAEWTADWYAPYAATPVTDPVGPSSGTARAVRDTSWRDPKIDFARSTNRIQPPPTRIDDQIGFRCARTVSGDAPDLHRR